ncbi:MAG: cell envelope integrity protein CreD [Treponema sp.]|jgi:inner membrane protein|nr:cell envelope integrity protein CreD [Treponema sp.]
MEQEKKLSKFTRGYTFKIIFLAVMLLLLLIPLSMIRGLVNERNRTADTAEADIMEAWGSELVAAGPFLIIPGNRSEETRRSTQNGDVIDIVKKPFSLIIAPEKLAIEADFKTEVRRRGIFSVPLFFGDLSLSGSFNPAKAASSLAANEEIYWDQAEIVLVLSSQKGIRKIDRALWNGHSLFFQPGNRELNIVRRIDKIRVIDDFSTGGIFAVLPGAANTESVFDISIAMQGGRMVRLLPTGQDTRVTVSTDWASPSFQGSFLPGKSTITDSGFSAEWDISYLSRDIPLFWKHERGEGNRRDYSASLFGWNFFRSINTYSLNIRAVKYAILFLIVPFLTLFLLEIFTKKNIHPVPYLLSGIANIIFYLLLLSLSEQMIFHLAYLISALAVIILLTLYSRSLLPSWNKSWYMGIVVTISYILLYAVLNAESYALLIGSIGAFTVVALVMYLTRKLNWYKTDE